MTSARGKRQAVAAERASRVSQPRAVSRPPVMAVAKQEPAAGMAPVKRERESLSPPDAERVAVKRKTCDLDFDTLKCPICTMPLSVPVYQCRNGHITCSACYLNLKKDLCPSCSTKICKHRNTAVEKIVESVLVGCKHAYYGCKEMLKYTEKKEHEARMCKYRPCHCPVPDCTFEGSTPTIPHHFALEHNAPTFVLGSAGSLQGGSFAMGNLMSKYAILELKKGLFLVHHELANDLRHIFFCTSFGSSLDNTRYNLRVGFCNDNESSNQYSITRITASDNQQEEGISAEVISRGDFLTVPRPLMKHSFSNLFEGIHFSLDFWLSP